MYTIDLRTAMMAAPLGDDVFGLPAGAAEGVIRGCYLFSSTPRSIYAGEVSNMPD